MAEKACADQRPVTAGAVDDHRRIAVELFQAIDQHGERDGMRPVQDAGRCLSRIPDVDELNGRVQTHEFGEVLDGQPGARLDKVRAVHEELMRVGQVADDLVEADSGQSHIAFESECGIADEHDLAVRVEHIPRPFGEPPVEADVDRTLKMTRREV